MADFLKAFNISKDNAGGYVNDPDDPGGETYRDISRKYNPKWIGWNIIDNIKSKTGTIAKNFTNKELDELAAAFYKQTYWNKLSLDKIKSQPNANQLFDQLLDGVSRTIQMVKFVLNNNYNTNFNLDSTVTDDLINTVNRINESAFFNAFKKLREKRFLYAGGQLPISDITYNFFAKFGKPPSTGSKYLKGWLNRVNKYSIEVASGTGILLLIIGAFILFKK